MTRRARRPWTVRRRVRRTRHGRTVSWVGSLFGTRWWSRTTTRRTRR